MEEPDIWQKRMGISDDIRPKKVRLEEPVIEEIAPQDEDHEDGQIEIPIDKSGKKKPVLDDIMPEPPKPFEHLDHIHDEITPSEILHNPNIAPEDSNKMSKKSYPKEEKPVSREDSFKTFAEYHEKQPKKSHLLTIIIVLFVILLTALLVLQNLDQIKELMGLSTKKTDSSQSSNAGVEVIGSQDVSSANDTGTANQSTSSVGSSSTSTDQPTASATPEVTTPEATTTPVAPTKSVSAVTIKVLNGNGISGSAAKVKTTLEAAGYTVSSVTNASKFTYTKTIIYYNTNLKTEADAVANILSARQTEVTENATITGTSDIVVVVGKS